MSVNHLSSNLPETHWWTQQYNLIMDSSHPPKSHTNSLFYTDHQHHPPQPTFDFNLNLNHSHHHESQQQQQQQQEDFHETTQQIHKEPMFEKPLTPSDVGKLNRLVIPKQHAEKYFPLGGSGAESVDQQKGLLLSFEDESGKPWRFRYSYWNSSQSYVLTKGWSRFVKEKRLDAGDVVLFERHKLDGDRLFIGWRRRSAAVPMQDSVSVGLAQPAGGGGGASAHVSAWTTRMFYDAQSNYPSHHLPLSLPLPYQPDCLHAGVGTNDNVDNNQRGGVGASGNPRRVRLFGVNLECPDDSEPSTPDGSSQSSQGAQPHYQYYSNANHLNHNTTNINFNQMRYHQG